MTSSMPPIKIHVLDPDEGEDDVPLTDVGVVNIDGERHLFLSPQSFYSAVRQVKSAIPELPTEQIECLVRDHCEFKDFDELLGPPAEPAPPVHLPPLPSEPRAPARPRGRAKRWAVAAALLPALAGSWALGHFTATESATTTASIPSAASDQATDDENLGPEPFTAREFMNFSDAGKIECNPIAALEAECTDSDGMVMSTTAATGPDSTIFTFSYGSERIGLRIFGDADYAKTWERQDGSQALYPNMARSGRYVLWGTDKERLAEYLQLLESAPRKVPAAMHSMGGVEPLPPRLAALTLGTLGLDEQDVHTILFASQDAPVNTPVLMAAQAVLGMNTTMSPTVEPGGDDIVALAAGLELPPVVTKRDQATHTSGGAALVTAPTTGTTSAGDSSQQVTEASAPPANPAPEPRTTENEQTRKPAEEKPEASVKPTATEPPTDPPAPEPEQPEEPSTTPVDPASPTTETPAPPQAPPGETSPLTEVDTSAERPPLGEHGESVHESGELLALPHAWIAPAG
ncbi:hypothetical protein ACIGW8_20515 [Streptomyces sioyaensis]|uniref:hypothetical protein n=1 Tax=Streptomyces sioyaensis TaxID=67364 RepID=UPI0037D97ACE